jgi:hypothetical protein
MKSRPGWNEMSDGGVIDQSAVGEDPDGSLR